MAPRLSWSKLVPGIVALTMLVIATILLLAYGGVGRVRGDTVRLYLVTNQAQGVMRGTEVWLVGQKVGVVEEITFRRPGTDTLGRVVIAIDLSAGPARQIRHDSEFQVRTGGTVIGPMVVYVRGGTPGGRAVRSGDTLYAKAQSDFGSAGAKLDVALSNVAPLIKDAKTVIALTRNTNGTVGAALAERGGTRIAALRANFSEVKSAFASGDGTARAEFMRRARRALARVDSVRTLLASEQASFGRFRRDSTLGRTVADVRDEIAELRVRLREQDGSLARFANDSAITRSLAAAQQEMTLLFDDMRKRPLRYIAF